jgi:hypothetical protein
MGSAWTLCTTLLVAVWLAGGGTRARAQEDDDATSGRAAAPKVDDEIVVRGRNYGFMREQIRIAEQAVYDRFNDINSSDDFDISCRREALTGSRILRRVCQAKFWRDAQADAGQAAARMMQGGAAVNPAVFLAEALHKRALLEDEFRKLATQDAELQDALVRLATLQTVLSSGKIPPLPKHTAAAARSNDQGLPYDAAAIVDVRIGRDAWRHTLGHRTFTIANVYGEVRSVDALCEGGEETLTYEAGVEWTIPDDWGSCNLSVEAPRGTTFSLYEFD